MAGRWSIDQFIVIPLKIERERLNGSGMNGDGGRNSPFMETVGGRVSTDRESNKTRDDVISFKIDQSADNSNKNIIFFFKNIFDGIWMAVTAPITRRALFCCYSGSFLRLHVVKWPVDESILSRILSEAGRVRDRGDFLWNYNNNNNNKPNI